MIAWICKRAGHPPHTMSRYDENHRGIVRSIEWPRRCACREVAYMNWPKGAERLRVADGERVIDMEHGWYGAPASRAPGEAPG